MTATGFPDGVSAGLHNGKMFAPRFNPAAKNEGGSPDRHRHPVYCSKNRLLWRRALLRFPKLPS